MLTPELREFLLYGAPANAARAKVQRLGGPATLLVQWRRHRTELMAACDPGRRPWAYWALEKRLRVIPRSELEARALRTLRHFTTRPSAMSVERRLRAEADRRRAMREALRAVA